MLKKLIYQLFTKKITIAKWQLNLFAVIIFSAGAVFGVFYLTNSIVLPKLVAADSPWTDTDWSAGGDYTSINNIDNSTGGQIELEVNADWFNSNWSYRKDIAITNSGSELEDFQVEISLDTNDLIDSGKMQADCGDIRFTNSSGTGLDYWIETGCNSDNTTVWVEIDSLGNGETTIYYYYGNSLAANGSSGEDTFLIYEEFSSLPDDWTAESSPNTNWEIVDNTLRSSTVSNDYSSYTKDTPSNLEDFVIEVDWKYSGVTHGGLNFRGQDEAADHAYMWILRPTYNPAQSRIQIRTPSQSYPISQQNTGTDTEADTWYALEIKVVGEQIDAYIDGTEAISGDMNNTTYTSGKVGFQHYDGTNYFDNFRVRKAVSSEPSVGSPGSEENKYPTSGNLKSVIFDAGFAADWGDFVFDYIGSGTVTVRTRTSNNSDMSGADGWTATCNVDYGCVGGVCTSSTSLEESTDCVTNAERYFQYQVVLEPDGAETPTFTETRVHFQASDQTDPEVQASNSKMYTEDGGTEITDADEDEDSWINDSIPYFSWTEGEDDAGGSGMLGYCLYLGTSSSGDPRTSKGILGTSPELTASTDCEGGFIIGTNEIDLTTSSYRGSSWLSSNGSYYLNITAIDNSGNAKGTPFESFHFQYDGTNPTNPSGLSAPQTYQSQIENITIYWATTGTSGPTDDDSGVAGYQYRIGDTGAWYGSGHTGDEDSGDLISAGFYTLNTDHDELSEGENTFYLRTWDNAGNVADSAISAILKYSGNAPSEPNELAVTPATNDENSFGFSWSVPTTYDGQASGLSYCYTINAVPSSTNCTWTSETSLTADAYATQPSTNTLYVVAKDEAGNVNYDAYASVNFDCDTSAPGVPRNMDIADISIKATSNWKLAISWDPPEATGAGVTSYKIYRSITASADCSSNINEFEDIGTTGGTSYSDADLSQTDYYYCAKACDSANNCSAVSSTVTGYPDGKFTEPAGLTAGPTVSGVTTKKATISWSTDRTADSKIQYGTGSGDYYDEEVASSTHTTDHSITLTNLSAGQTYYYRAKWTDEDGNTGMSEEKSFTTDPSPTVKEVEVTNIGLTTALVNFTVANAAQVKIYYGETTSYGGLSEVTTSTTESTYAVQLTGLADGTKYYYKMNAFDSEDEEYEGDVYSFETLPRPRISQVRLEEITGSAQPAVLVSWQTNTSISSILTYYPTDNPGQAKDKVNIQLKQGEHRMLLKDLLPDKTYVLVVKGRDKVGNEAESDQQTFTTATDTRPPVIGNLKVEGTIQGTGEEAKAQLLVSFNTDEPATSQVEFGEGTGTTYSQKTQEDADLTNNHLVIVPNLSPSKVYHLRAIAKDKAGNETKSVDTVSITPKATESALNLVITNLSEVFGFLSQ